MEKSDRMKLSVEELTSEKKTLETQVSLSRTRFVGPGVEENKSVSCDVKITLAISA